MEKNKVKKEKFDFGVLAQRQKEEFSRIPLIKLYYSSVAISILLIALVLFSQSSLPPQVPLYFGLAEGEEQLVPPVNLLYPPILALGITTINAMVVLKLKNDLLQRVLATASFSVTMFSFITTVRILLLVGSF